MQQSSRLGTRRQTDKLYGSQHISILYPVTEEHNHVIVEIESVGLGDEGGQHGAVLPGQAQHAAEVAQPQLRVHPRHQAVGRPPPLQLLPRHLRPGQVRLLGRASDEGSRKFHNHGKGTY